MSRSARWIEWSACAALALAACGGGRGRAITALDWEQTPPASGHVVDGAVEIAAPNAGGTFPLAAIESPPVGGLGYAIEGQIRYEGVTGGAGYLEMWSVFPDGSRYFSRTLAETGPLAAISGDSAWRPFQLPFSLEGTASTPERLEINLVLPSAGRVWVSSARLVPVGDDANGAWWSDRTAGIAGGIGGSAVGGLAALLGTLAARGRARRFVLTTMLALLSVGGAMLGVGVAAVVASQPYGVTGTLFIGGAILVVLMGLLVRTVRGAYARAELRRMRALDAVG